MCAFGAALGVVISALPDWSGSRAPYDLNQDWKFARNMTFAAILLAEWAAIRFTSLTVQWKPLLISFAVSGVAVGIAMDAVVEGRVAAPWAAFVRALYRDETYRHVPFEPARGPCLDTFDPIAWSIGNALVCAHLSRIAYLPDEEVRQRASGWAANIRLL